MINIRIFQKNCSLKKLDLIIFKLVRNNPCQKNSCENEGKCFSDNTGLLKCICKDGYSGDKCEITGKNKIF